MSKTCSRKLLTLYETSLLWQPKNCWKATTSTDPADNNFVSPDVDNYINNIRRSPERASNAKEHGNNLNKWQKKFNCRRLQVLIRYNGNINSWSNNRGNDPPCQRLYGWFCIWYCVITLRNKWFKQRQKIAQSILKLVEEVSDGGKRDVLVSQIINKDDDLNHKWVSVCKNN